MLAAGAAAVFVVVHAVGGDAAAGALREWVERAGPWAPAVFVLLYVVATNLGLPGTPLTIVGGAMFGAVAGSVLGCVASTLAACAMFLIARRIGGGRARSDSGSRITERPERALERRGAAWIVFSSRLLPLPFLALNYAWGWTPIRFRTYAWASALGMVPMNVLFAAGGDAAGRWLTGSGTAWLLAALVVLCIVAALVVRLARNRLLRADLARPRHRSSPDGATTAVRDGCYNPGDDEGSSVGAHRARSGRSAQEPGPARR